MKEEKNNKMIPHPGSLNNTIIIHQLLSGKMKETDDLAAIRTVLRKWLHEDYHKQRKK